jgi:hypothetical protein
MQTVEKILSYKEKCSLVLTRKGLATLNLKKLKERNLKNDSLYYKLKRNKLIHISQRDGDLAFGANLEDLKEGLKDGEELIITLDFARGANYQNEGLKHLLRYVSLGWLVPDKKSNKEGDLWSVGLWTSQYSVYEKFNYLNPDNEIRLFTNQRFNEDYKTAYLNKSELINFFASINKISDFEEQEENTEGVVFFGVEKIKIPVKNLFKGTFIAGKTGSGKSIALLDLISLIKDKADTKFLLVDPKEDTAIQCQSLFGQSKKRGIRYNPLAYPVKHLDHYVETLLQVITDGQKSVYIEQYFRYILTFALKYNREQTEAKNMLNFVNLHKIAQNPTKQPQYSRYDEILTLSKAYSSKQNEMIYHSFVTRLEKLARISEFNSQELGITFENNNFVALPKVNLTNGSNDIIVRFLVINFWFWVLETYRKGKKHFLVIEEASTVDLPFLVQMLSTIRSNNVGIILISQYAAQLSKDLKASIKDNINNYFVGFSGADSIDFLASAMQCRKEKLASIKEDSYEFYVKAGGEVERTKTQMVFVRSKKELAEENTD